MLAREVDGIVRIRADFARRLAAGDAEVQVLVHGTDANRARIIAGLCPGRGRPVGGAAGGRGRRRSAGGPVVVQSRLWFNEANDSHYFLVPGLIVLVMTLIGALLTAHGDGARMGARHARGAVRHPGAGRRDPAGQDDPLLRPGHGRLALCVLAGRFLFHVPFRGSVWVLVGVSMLYLLVALGIGLLISSAIKSQFVASQLTLLVTFLPAMMLSGFLFDLRSMPAGGAAASPMSLPARYYVALLQTLFLAGDVWSVILPNAAVLAVHGGGPAAADPRGRRARRWREARHGSIAFSASSP